MESVLFSSFNSSTAMFRRGYEAEGARWLDHICRNPTLAKCGGEAQHFQSWGFGVLRDSRMFRARQQGPKHLALKLTWCHWKGLET
jgi:hypothetical protein